MNLFQLVLKQMRQRSLSTILTLLSVLLGVALAVGIMILRRDAEQLFAQTDFGYEIILGPPKGAPLQLTLNTVYHLDTSPGNVPYQLYEDMARKSPAPAGRPDYRRYVKSAVPFMVGDSYQGRRIVGTSPQMFGVDDAGNPIADGIDEDGNRVINRFQYRAGKTYEFAEGRPFALKKFEAVVGSDVAKRLHVHLYDPSKSEQENLDSGGAFRATHGMPGPNDKNPDIHKPAWRIVGILKPTGTANDRVLFVPFISLYAIAEHEGGLIDQALLKAKIDPSKVPPDRVDDVLRQLGIDPSRISPAMRAKFTLAYPATRPATHASTTPADVGDLMTDAALPAAEAAPATPEKHEDPDAYHLDADGNIVPDLPQDEWQLSAIFVKTRGGFGTQNLLYNFKVIEDRASAVNPADVMRQFFDTFLSGSTTILLVISALVSVVAGASITTSIYNSVSARQREIAILRALGATRGRVLTIICTEAVLIGLIGGLIGMIVGHALTAVGSVYTTRTLGESIDWISVDRYELYYFAAVVVLAFFAGLVPGMKAYKTSVAANLAGG